jgi:hypothetical protein
MSDVPDLAQELAAEAAARVAQHDYGYEAALVMAARRRAYQAARTAIITEAANQQFIRLATDALGCDAAKALWAQVNQGRAQRAELTIAWGLRAPPAAVLRELNEADAMADVFEVGVTASAETLTEGSRRVSQKVYDPVLRRKHAARLRAAMYAMAEALDEMEGLREPMAGDYSEEADHGL